MLKLVRLITTNGIIQYVFVNQDEKLHVSFVEFPPKQLEYLESIAQYDDYYPDCGENETIFTVSTKFIDDIEADIKICNGSTPFIDPVLFNASGGQLQVLDCEDSFEGEYEFNYEDSIYRVIIGKMNEFEQLHPIRETALALIEKKQGFHIIDL